MFRDCSTQLIVVYCCALPGVARCRYAESCLLGLPRKDTCELDLWNSSVKSNRPAKWPNAVEGSVVAAVCGFVEVPTNIC